MPTLRQANGTHGATFVQRNGICVSCGCKHWKTVGREQLGIDLQCRACGRFAESKSRYCRGPLQYAGLDKIPGGSFYVRERQREQGYKVDLYVTFWNRKHEFVVRAIAAELQPADMVCRREILTGTRAGYVLADLDLSRVPEASFPIVASRFRHLMPQRRRRHPNRIFPHPFDGSPAEAG